ncbi:MAG: P-loop NTPase [Chitinivibrionales bacterium]|nr:P-loop NTPase [Chitinivibrionales bacterium]MBD3397000.1 P-loop NTPase [Chitinivibrionales bacterium]
MERPIVISVGSGKGGVGKSSLTANVGALLAGKGYRVGFVDADLEGANLHLCLGVRRPRLNLQDYLSGRVKDLREIAVETIVPGTWLVSGASDILQLSNPRFGHKQKIITNLKKLDADYLLVDLGAGTDNTVVDFFGSFSYGIVIADVLPASVETAYGFLKNATVRGLSRLFPGRKDIHEQIRRFSDSRAPGGFATLERFLASLAAAFPAESRAMKEWIAARRILLVLNMVRSREDVAAGARLAEIVKKYLSVNLFYVGYVAYTNDIRRSLRRLRPAVLDGPSAQTRECFAAVTANIEALTRG